MTEKQLREKVVAIATKYLGCKESNGSHKKIIDIYNKVTPLPVGYKVKYTDAWCATYVSVIGIEADLSDIILRECGCQRMISLYQKAGRWMENDAYIPKKGDIIFYDWDDTGSGDNTGYSDHVGIVADIDGTTLKIIEGNMNNAVGYRTIKVNNKFIRGYGVPNYASKATDTSADKADKAVDTSANKITNIKIDTADYLSKSLSGTYKATTTLNLRSGAGTSKSILVVIPKNGKVNCYGYYNIYNGVKWYYVTYRHTNGVTYTGFVSSKYLKK